MIFYEYPFRLIKLLEQIAAHFGSDRLVSVSRELTKLYEENFRGTCAEVLVHFQSKAIKGEIVVVVHGHQPTVRPDDQHADIHPFAPSPPPQRKPT